MLNHILEILRWAGVGVGFYLAFSLEQPAEQINVLCLWLVLCLAGLTGIESVFLGKTAREQSGYHGSGAYQRQSGFNNLALALATLLVYALGWGVQAKLSLLSALLIFMALSAGNHAYSAVKEGNKSLKNLLRPFMTALLLAFTIPFMARAL